MSHWSYRFPKPARFVNSRLFLLVAVPISLTLVALAVVGTSQLVGHLMAAAYEPQGPGPSIASTTEDSASSPPPLRSEPAAEPTPQTTEQLAVGFTCWNGSSVSDLGECPRPRKDSQAFSYLEYVYPAVAEFDGECERRSTPKKYDDVAAYFNCPMPGVTNVRFRYWRDISEAEHHYDEDDAKFGGARMYDVIIGDQWADGWVRTYDTPDKGRLTVTMFLPEHHLSLSVEGKSTKAIWAEFERTRIRPVEEMLGYPTAEGPSVTLLGRG